MAGTAGAHLRVLVAELHDLGHRRMHVRAPVRDVVEVVGARARHRHVADGAHPVGGVARRRLILLGHRERPLRLLGGGRQSRHQRKRKDACELFHEFPPKAVMRAAEAPTPRLAAMWPANKRMSLVRHSGARRRREPGIHTHSLYLWIPGSSLSRRPGMTPEGSNLKPGAALQVDVDVLLAR